MKWPPFLSRFSRRQEIVGMDCGTCGTKFLRGLSSGWEKVFFPGPLLTDPDRQIPACREFLRENRLDGASVACGIEHPSIKIRRIDLPKMPDYDLQEAVRWQLRDVADGSVDTYVVRYSVLDEYLAGEIKRLSLLAYMIKREAVTTLTQLLKKLSLKPVTVEPNAVSLLAAVDSSHRWKSGETYAVVDLGGSKSLFLVLGDQKLFFSRPMGGISLSEAGPDQANFYTALAIEIQKSMDAYSLMFHKEKVERLLLVGGGASLPDLGSYLTKNLGIPTEVFNPLPEWEAAEGSRYAVALGLALYA